MKILILGGGISGLSAAFFCSRRYPSAQITLIEKEAKLGGWMQTQRSGGFLFEEGPRTFPFLRSPDLCSLIADLGLEKEILFSSKKSAGRYIYHREKLRSIPLFSLQFLPSMLLGAWKKNLEGDVSIYDFISHRFGARLANLLFDPLVLGIYGGDIRKLSMQSCFPNRFSLPKGPLFTLKRGMSSLIDAIIAQVPMQIISSCPIEQLLPNGAAAQGRFWEADLVISALPMHELARITNSSSPASALSLSCVFLAYPGPVLSKQGFGYLIPSAEKESVMGMVWDSSIFPQQNAFYETRLTAMVRASSLNPIEDALSAAHRHLKIREKPIYSASFSAENAIPQFEVGYAQRLEVWKGKLLSCYPKLRLAGNYLGGVSVEACVRSAKEAIV